MPEKIINNVGYIIQQICSITGGKPGKTAIQKTVYLVQMEGLDLGYKYRPHCFSVYSETLDSAINLLVAGNIFHVERKGNSNSMEIDSSCIIESDLGKEAEEKIERVIRKYNEKTPSETGLLTTAHYISKKMTDRDLPDIVRGVKKIMGAKHSEEAIKEAIQELDLLVF